MRYLWQKLKNDKDFIIYFPDKFKQATPPRTYFMEIYAQIKRDQYNDLIKSSMSDYMKIRRTRQENVRISEDALNVFNQYTEESIKLLSILRSEKTD